ncbi:sigma-54-dependent Fis family transcriptional regulator [Aquitalea sp. USM4]|uniref:sigma-54-dependent Fis family transcriptional regulator n=1 Tax=Aquitalea sp. USM4 TaxID=1590041 RepID=UPI001039B74C|nr:sigma-54-dependent Fis family transcriptional regulator [Aquitalea sp. USM4]QBJ79544.1 sigma-54-dependent Fis family transcriptional regulator [Aquitalea sp. USM4]
MPRSKPLIPSAVNDQRVASCWEAFICQESSSSDVVRQVIWQSWLRCRSSEVNPTLQVAPVIDSKQLLTARCQQAETLLGAARPVMGLLREVLKESGSMIMLADADGMILDQHGAHRARQAGEQVNLAPGGFWTESLIGTNAIGTAIATGQPVQIHANEHYCLDIKQWTCAAAPIFDPYSQALLGVIDLSGRKDTFHGHSLGLAIAAARQIECTLLQQAHSLNHRLLELSTLAFNQYRNDCLLLFDRHGRLLKQNGKLHEAQQQHGVSLLHDGNWYLPACNLGDPAELRQQQAPAWLQQGWVQGLQEKGQQLGSLLIIPLRQAGTPVKPAVCASPQPPADAFDAIIGSSPGLHATRQQARRLAVLDLPVLLLGETGVGKELFARAIHQSSGRATAPFVALNCGALSRDLLASELFGYVDGAFTGARRGGMPGKIEQADGGTLFLDEIGEMPLEVQPHLLRVLEDGRVVRLGDRHERQIKLRLVAATNRDLQAEVACGRFRSDLYHRLCVSSVLIPPLRSRKEDIIDLIAHLDTQFARKYGTTGKRLGEGVMAVLTRHDWPGNVRELRNVYEMLFALCDGECIDMAQLPPDLLTGRMRYGEQADINPQQENRLDAIERQAIERAIAQSDGNLSRAARSLGISRSTLYTKLAGMRASSKSVRKD